MKLYFYLPLLLLFLFLQPAASYAQVRPNPKVDVLIELKYDTVATVDSLILKITLVNHSPQVQQVLFDKPGPASRAPWGTTAIVVDAEGGHVELMNKAKLSSQVYFDEQLKTYYYSIAQGEQVSATYYLTDILVMDEEVLKRGDYTLQLIYFDNWSNKLRFWLE